MVGGVTMNIILKTPMLATSNNVAISLTESQIFALCGDIEGFMASKGIVCKGVAVQ